MARGRLVRLRDYGIPGAPELARGGCTTPLLPSWPGGSAAWAALVAVLGTTISPYLFFWQAGQEVEEEKARGRRLVVHRRGATSRELVDRRIDVGVGTFFSNLVMFFIILTTALTLHRHGIMAINTTRGCGGGAAAARRRSCLFPLHPGHSRHGLLAIPTLAGSAAYAFAETFDWAYGMDESASRTRCRFIRYSYCRR